MRRLNRILPAGKLFIKNSNSPVCLNCLHFIRPTFRRDDYELHGRCKKFKEMNLITGENEYSLARNCRLDDKTCGHIGAGYEEKLGVL